MLTLPERKALIRSALGEIPLDLLIKNGLFPNEKVGIFLDQYEDFFISLG